MQTSDESTVTAPVLPGLLTLPLKLIPSVIQNKALISVLNKIFQQDINDGELDFLLKKVLRITVEDANIEFSLSFDGTQLIAGSKDQADLSLKGTVYHFLLLASRKEDTDTLFFNRQLHMQGDTELGLYVKNFLDGLDMETHKASAYIEILLKKSLPVYERIFSRKP